jgi:hypothetical protein
MKILKRISKIIAYFIALLLLFILILFGVDSYQTSYLKAKNIKESNNTNYLIKNVNVITMTKDTILLDKMVYIENGFIKSIGDSLAIKGVKIIDAKNKYLTPGLIDMHVHVWDRYELGLYLSNGVTTVRNLWGIPMHLRLKEKINNGEIISPNFFTTSPKLTGPEFFGDDNIQLTTVKDAKEKIISYKERGFDFIKTYYGLTQELFDAVLEQSIESNIDIVAHPTPEVAYAYHFNPQIKTIEHAEDIVQQPLNYKLDTIKLKSIIDLYANNPNSTMSPTLIVYNNIYNILMDDDILSSERVKLMNPLIQMVDSKAQFDRWNSTKKNDSSIINRIKKQHEFHLSIIKKLNDKGVNIVASTDAGIGITVPGYAIHDEFALYKKAGLTNYEILKTATVNASKVHTVMKNIGTIEINKKANLLLLDNNPLEDLSTLKKPHTVFVNGIRLNRKTLDTFNEKAVDRNNLIVSGIRYLEYLLFER